MKWPPSMHISNKNNVNNKNNYPTFWENIHSLKRICGKDSGLNGWAQVDTKLKGKGWWAYEELGEVGVYANMLYAILIELF